MTTATIVKAWKAGGSAHVAVRVTEASGDVEYIGSTPLVDDEGETKTLAALKSELRAAVVEKRNAQIAGAEGVAWTGTVEV